MNDIQEQPEYYEVNPEFNSDGRLCNYHTGGDSETVHVPADEWERFNLLAGRQHEVVDGVVAYNESLAPCMPDPEPPDMVTELQLAVVELYELLIGGEV